MALEGEVSSIDDKVQVCPRLSVTMAKTPDEKRKPESMELLFVNVNLADLVFFIQMLGTVCIRPNVLTYLL